MFKITILKNVKVCSYCDSCRNNLREGAIIYRVEWSWEVHMICSDCTLKVISNRKAKIKESLKMLDNLETAVRREVE
jgi:MinD superfamily P-loop ATPase